MRNIIDRKQFVAENLARFMKPNTQSETTASIKFDKEVLTFESFIEKNKNEGGATPEDVSPDDDFDEEE